MAGLRAARHPHAGFGLWRRYIRRAICQLRPDGTRRRSDAALGGAVCRTLWTMAHQSGVVGPGPRLCRPDHSEFVGWTQRKTDRRDRVADLSRRMGTWLRVERTPPTS